MPRPTNSALDASLHARAASSMDEESARMRSTCSAVSASSWNSRRTWFVLSLPFTWASSMASSVSDTTWPRNDLVEATAISLLAFV